MLASLTQSRNLLNMTAQLMYGIPVTPKKGAGSTGMITYPGRTTGPDVHINIEQALQEASTLEAIADEVRTYSQKLDAALDEMSSIWMGESARRAEQVITDKIDLTGKLADNIELIALGVRGTAQAYQLATMRSGGKTG